MDVARHLDQLMNAALDRGPHAALVACRRLERDELPWLTERKYLADPPTRTASRLPLPSP